jgi:hypothetical protein
MVTENEFHQLRERMIAEDPTLAENSFTSKLPDLLEVLGHPSCEFRDNLGWSTLSAYFRSSICPHSARARTLELLLSDKFLFYKIDSGETPDSVKRTFSILTIADILGGDLKNGAKIESTKINFVAQELRRYLDLEKDWRGHDSVLGWVHALAHLGDAFWALASHPSLDQEELSDCLNTLLSHMEKRGGFVFMWQEDYRLARGLSVMFEKLSEDFCRALIEEKYARSLLFEIPALQNILTTFRCVYLEMHWDLSKRVALMETIKKMIY